MISVSFYSSGIFTTRTYFENINSKNDNNSQTNEEDGIRSHNWFTALFLSIFGKITTVQTLNGKKIYLNTGSLKKWLNRHKQETGKQNGALDGNSAAIMINNVCKTLMLPPKKNENPEESPSHKSSESNKSSTTLGNSSADKEQNHDVVIMPLPKNQAAIPSGSQPSKLEPVSDLPVVALPPSAPANGDCPADKILASRDPKEPKSSTKVAEGMISKVYGFVKNSTILGVKIEPAVESLRNGMCAFSALKQGKIRMATCFALQSVGYGMNSIINMFLSPDLKQQIKLEKL